MAFVYSCCFWFSLRLGGILIGIFSLALLVLVACCVAHTRLEEVQEILQHWLSTMNLIFAKNYIKDIAADPEKIINLTICFMCFYTLLSVLFICGAYKCNNMLMMGYILAELTRLIMLSILVITWLLVLKQNTMDIGLLIGASVACGFFLLGMFYLWVCTANLPILINEMERDEQAATIQKLQQLLQTTSKSISQGLDNPLINNAEINKHGVVMGLMKRQGLNDRNLLISPIPYYNYNR